MIFQNLFGEKGIGSKKNMKLSFVSELPERNAKCYIHKGVNVFYHVQKDHLIVQGSIFSWNWNSSFKQAVQSLQKSLIQSSASSCNHEWITVFEDLSANNIGFEDFFETITGDYEAVIYHSCTKCEKKENVERINVNETKISHGNYYHAGRIGKKELLDGNIPLQSVDV